MQTVSTQWKEALGCYDTPSRPNFVPVSFVEIEYGIIDPEAQANVQAYDNGSTAYSDTAQIVMDEPELFVDFATLELNNWTLNGNTTLQSSGTVGTGGFTSSVLCGADCTFESNPLVTLTFDKVYTTVVPGLTIEWSNAYQEWASAFNVHVYNGSTLVQTINVTGNTTIKSVVSADITNYDKIVIEIVEWCLPFHRARIESIITGVITVFDKSSLLGYEHTNATDPLSLTLPENGIVFQLTNVDGEWNPDNPIGQVKYLIEQQPVTVRYGYKIGNAIEWIKAGTFYMNGWDTPSNGISASFEASSLVQLMDAPYTVGTKTLTLSALAQSAFTQADLPTNANGSAKWSIDSSLSSISVTLPDNFNHTCAEVVQLCANAACCIVRVDRDGNINIEPLANTVTDYLIDQFVSYSNAEYSLSKPLKSVVVNETMASVSAEQSGETQEIKNELIQSSSVATSVANWVKNMLVGRKTLNGDYRPDPRLDAADTITTQNKYATNTVIVTSVRYSYNGAFTGHFEGRVTV